jgi:RHS repeat-associated protein
MKKIRPIILSVILTVSLLPFGYYGSTENNETSTQSLSQEYSVQEAELDALVREGNSLNDIERALLLQQETGVPFQSILDSINPKVMNISEQAQSEIHSDLPVSTSSSVEIRHPGSKPTSIDPSKLLTAMKAKPNEAPYKVSLNDESVSTISGGLTYEETDAYIPGRNGMSFALTRTYQSQDAQLYDMDVQATYGPVYYLDIPVVDRKEELVYTASTTMKAYQEVDLGCNNPDGALPDTKTYLGGSRDYSVVSSDFSTYEAANKHSFPSVVKAWSEVSCERPDNGEIPTVPNIPSVSATSTSNTVSLSWGYVSGANSYKVYENGSFVGETSGTSYTITGLTPNTSYTFGVRAHNENGDSGEGTVSVQTKQTATQIPSAPTGITYYKTWNDVTLNWNSVNGATGYKIYKDGSSVGSTSGTSFYISGLAENTQYTFGVSAVNEAGESSQSTVVVKTSPKYCNGFCEDFIPPTTTAANDVPKKTRISYYPDTTEVSEDLRYIELPNENPYVERIGPYSEAQVELLMEIFQAGEIFSWYPLEKEGDKEIQKVQMVTGNPIKTGPFQEPSYYYNTTSSSKPNPLGIGWSWNIPYLETKVVNGVTKQFVSLGNGSVYEVNGNLLKGDFWNQFSFSLDSTITRNDPQTSQPSNNQSKYVLSSIEGRNYYFNEKGQILVISDSYGNQIKFYYQERAPYGTVIRSIEDSIGNQIQISFTTDPTDGTDLVEIQNGLKKVSYRKQKVNNQEVLAQVIDASGKKTFSYEEKQAKFNLLGTEPLMNNPYMLLTGVTHPTQAKTIYTYEEIPVKNYTSQDSVNQFYKIRNRYEEIYYTDQTSERYNKMEYSYIGDLGTQADYTYQTIRKGLTTTTYTIKKDYIDADTAPAFYITNEEESGTSITRETTNLYDEANRNPLPITIKTKNVDLSGGTSSEVTINRQYQYGRVSLDENPLQTFTIEYSLQEITLPSTSKYKMLLPKKEIQVNKKNANENGTNGTETVETSYLYGFDGSGNIQSRVVTTSSNNQLLRKEKSQLDAYGNSIENITYKKYINENEHEELREIATFDSIHHAFATQIKMDVKDAKGNLSSIIKKFGYDTTTGNITSFIDGNGNSTELQYDLLDRLKLITFVHPEGGDYQTIEHVYNDALNEIETINEAGEKIKQTWTPLGWKSGEYSFQGGMYQSDSQMEYDLYGRLMKSTDAKGYETRYYTDEWNRPTNTLAADYSIDPSSQIESGGKTSYFYDDILHIVKMKDSNGNVIEEKADEFGRILEKTKKWKDPDQVDQTNSFEKYLYFGEDYQIEDANGNNTCYREDAVGQLKSVTYSACSPQDSNVQTYSYQYDLMGNMTQLSYLDINPKLNPDPNPQQKWMLQKEYDALGRLISEQGPEGGVKTYFYDGNNNLLETEDKNQNRFINQYNYRNFLTTREAYTGTVLKDRIEYVYDPAGRMIEMTDYKGTQIEKSFYEYYGPNDVVQGKNIGLLKKKTLPDGGTFSYQYDQNGNRTVLSLNLGGLSWSLNYSYDPQNRISSVNVPITGVLTENISETYTYQNNGLLETATRPGSVKTLTYNGLIVDKFTEQTKPNGPIFSSFKYQYDPNENTTRIEDLNGVQNFTYDELDRIKTSSIHQEMYTYDSRGNRHTLASDQLPPLETAQYEFDVWDRLSKVTTTDGNIVEYQYNGDGLLEERTENNATTRYYYDGDQIIAEGLVKPDGQVELKARYIRGATGLISRVSEDPAENLAYGGIAYYHTNGHGDVVSLRNKSGEILKSYSYDIWGNVESEVSNKTISNPFLYAGEYFDSATNLQYLRARWYDPSQGRFISEDRYAGDIKNPLSLNYYTYAENNPLKYVDPSGHAVETLLDLASIGYSSYQLAKNPSLANAGFLLWDVTAALVPFLPGSYMAKGAKAITKTVDKGKDVKKGKVPQKGSCNCFTAGTKIQTEDGEKNIEEIRVGDKVLAKDENNPNSDLAFKQVTALFRSQRDDIIMLNVGKQVIETTNNHPFWVEDKGWVFADELRIGDQLLQADGNTLTINNIEFIKLDKPVTVYNFEVSDYHTYYVSDIGIWVHNTNTKNCPRYESTRVKWDIKSNASDQKSYYFGGLQHIAYKDPKTGLYWVQVRAEESHGKTFQVYRRKGKNLVWEADANEYGDYITKKHKSEKGKIIKGVF